MRVLGLWFSILFIVAAHAQSSGSETIMWLPGMDSIVQEGHLWLKVDSAGHGSASVSIFENGQLIVAQLEIVNRSPVDVKVLPEQFIMTLTEPKPKPVEFIDPDRVPGRGTLYPTTIKPGQELKGIAYFKREPSCSSGRGCRGLLTVPVGETMFIFPVALGRAAGDTETAHHSWPTLAAPSPIPNGVQIHSSASKVASSRPGKERDWQTGKVLDYQRSRRVYESGSTTTAQTDGTISPTYGGSASVHTNTTATTTIQHEVVRTTDLFIVGDQYVYEVEDSTQHGGYGLMGAVVQVIINRKHGCRFIVGEKMRYAQEQGYLWVIDADGKECKTEILRQEKRQ